MAVAYSGDTLTAEPYTTLRDATLAALVSLATDACRGVRDRPSMDGARVLCPHFRVGEQLVRTITVVAQFGAARDVTLDELRIELVYPADDEAEAFFRSNL